jgi:hypothetical protein
LKRGEVGVEKNFFIKFGVVKEASRISYHEWQQSIGVIWNKHWTFGHQSRRFQKNAHYHLPFGLPLGQDFQH